MSWPIDAQLDLLLQLPWTVVREDDVDGTIVLRVSELPAAIGTGDTKEEAAADFWESLRDTLRCYLEHGDPIPGPKGMTIRLAERESSLPAASQPAVMTSLNLGQTALVRTREMALA